MIGSGSFCQVYACATSSHGTDALVAASAASAAASGISSSESNNNSPSLSCNERKRQECCTVSSSSSSSSSSSLTTNNNNQNNNNNSTVVVKCVSTRLDRRSKRFLVASLDLCLEAKLLERLNHDNIIRLHAVKATTTATTTMRATACTHDATADNAASIANGDNGDTIIGNGCSDTTTTTTTMEDAVNNRDYFIVVERLSETLQDRMNVWEEQYHKKYRWGGLFGGGRQQQKREELGRVRTAAIGIAKGMEYLHSKGIIYRYVIRTDVSCLLLLRSHQSSVVVPQLGIFQYTYSHLHLHVRVHPSVSIRSTNTVVT